MANSAFEDPALTAKALQASETAKPAAVPAAAAATAAPPQAAEPAAPAPAGAASALFPHYADALAASGLAPHKVKTQAIHPDSGPMLDDIAKASSLGAKDQPTARGTASHLIEEGAGAGVTSMNQYAYELATADRESHMGNWMNEFGGNAYFEKKYGMNSSHRNDLQNTHPGDGAAFHGRGLVQTTGRRNYTDWTDRLGKENFQHDGQPVDLVNHPDLAAQPDVAARIAVEGMQKGTFTHHKLSDYVNDDKTDFKNARRVINGMDHSDEIAAQATKFQGVLKQHSGDYADAVTAAQLKGLPSAQTGELSGNPGAMPDSMFDGKPMTAGSESFTPADKRLKNNLGRFDDSAPLPTNVTNVKTHAAS